MEQTTDIRVKCEPYYNAQFKRWCIGVHVNFDVPSSMYLLLEIKPGVEIIQVCTRYQFVVIVGSLFEYKEVINQIEDLIINWNS